MTEVQLAAAATEVGLKEGPGGCEVLAHTLFEGLKHLLADNIMGHARLCEASGACGVQLWRRLNMEWERCEPQVRHARARLFQDPERCSSVAALWDALPRWLQQGEGLEAAGMSVPDWLRSTAFDKLIPLELLNAVVARPLEPGSFAAKLAFIRPR